MIKKGREKGVMLAANPQQQYLHDNRKKRYDDMSEEAKKCIVEFCHSDEASRIDTNQFRSMEVEGSENPHEIRVWEVSTLKSKYEKFKQSISYQKIQQNQGRNICQEIFRRNLCPCVQNPTEHSCVDTIKTQLDEYQKGLRNFFLHNK